MATEKTSISLPAWVLAAGRQHAEAHGRSFSELVMRGILREIAASHASPIPPTYAQALRTTEDAEAQIATQRVVAEFERRAGEAA